MVVAQGRGVQEAGNSITSSTRSADVSRGTCMLRILSPCWAVWGFPCTWNAEDVEMLQNNVAWNAETNTVCGFLLLVQEEWPEDEEAKQQILADFSSDADIGDRRQELVFIGQVGAALLLCCS